MDSVEKEIYKMVLFLSEDKNYVPGELYTSSRKFVRQGDEFYSDYSWNLSRPSNFPERSYYALKINFVKEELIIHGYDECYHRRDSYNEIDSQLEWSKLSEIHAALKKQCELILSCQIKIKEELELQKKHKAEVDVMFNSTFKE